MYDCPAATIDHWRAECRKHGLFDGDPMDDVNRALFSKYKRELIAANYVACDDTMAWTLARKPPRERPAFKQLSDCPQEWCCACCGEPGNDEKGKVAKRAVNDPGAHAQVLHRGCADKYFKDT